MAIRFELVPHQPRSSSQRFISTRAAYAAESACWLLLTNKPLASYCYL
jgi:hypothetical protein